MTLKNIAMYSILTSLGGTLLFFCNEIYLQNNLFYDINTSYSDHFYYDRDKQKYDSQKQNSFENIQQYKINLQINPNKFSAKKDAYKFDIHFPYDDNNDHTNFSIDHISVSSTEYFLSKLPFIIIKENDRLVLSVTLKERQIVQLNEEGHINVGFQSYKDHSKLHALILKLKELPTYSDETKQKLILSNISNLLSEYKSFNSYDIYHYPQSEKINVTSEDFNIYNSKNYRYYLNIFNQ